MELAKAVFRNFILITKFHMLFITMQSINDRNSCINLVNHNPSLFHNISINIIDRIQWRI